MKKVNSSRVSSVHMAKAKLKNIDGNKHQTGPSSNGSYKSTEMYTTEFEINETTPSARTLLTKGYIQDEINSFSGATVSTRGRFMTDQEKARCPNERPLYLYIQGHTKHNIDLAIQKINDIIKTEHRSSLNRPSRFTNAPPPLMSLHSGIPSVEKICVGMENAPPGFDLRGRIVGAGGANLLYIRGETGANVTLRGRGSQFIDPGLGTESPEPLHLCIEHPNPVGLQNAKQLGINLIQTMQSELQSYIQQQPPPVQSQQVIQQSQMQQLQPGQFQTMNIGTLAQPNVVTIQHQDLIQHPQSSVAITLPATILTATVAGAPAPGALTQSGVHIPTHGGPSDQPQEIQTFVPPPSVGQVQLIGPPPGIGQVQYQIHPGQPLQIQGMPPTCSQTSPQPMTQMYVMSQPPPQQTFMSSSSAPINGAVSYVYTQPSVQRPNTPQNLIEAVNVNLQQPPPAGPMNMNQQPPPSLLHLHFPPPFPPNQPPPPISQTYQIQYQQVQVQAPPHQSQAQYVIQHGEHPAIPPQMPPNHDPQHIPQYEGQPPPPIPMHGPPPPSAQAYVLPNPQSPQHAQQPPLPPGGEMHHPPEGPVDQGMPPQPVPPPQIVPPPPVNQIPHSMNMITSIPPPTHAPPPPQAAPWLYQGQQPPQPQMQMQMPPTSMPLHGVPPADMQPQIQYHAQQIHYQNGQMQHQVHYAVQSQMQPHFEQNHEMPEHYKNQGLKRRFSDIDVMQEPLPHQINRPPTQRHGTGDGDEQLHIGPGPPAAGASLSLGERNKLLMPPSYPDERRAMDLQFAGPNSGCEQPPNGDPGRLVETPASIPMPMPPPHATWQTQHSRYPHGRPILAPKENERAAFHAPPPINLPPTHLRLIQGQTDDSRPSSQNPVSEHQLSAEYNQVPPYFAKPPPCNAIPLMHSICNPPPPPPSPPVHNQTRPQSVLQQYQGPVTQTHQAPQCLPWMN